MDFWLSLGSPKPNESQKYVFVRRQENTQVSYIFILQMNSRNAIEENASKSSLLDESFSCHTRLDVAGHVEFSWFEAKSFTRVIR